MSLRDVQRWWWWWVQNGSFAIALCVRMGWIAPSIPVCPVVSRWYLWIVCCSVSADQRKRTTTTTCPRVNPGLGRHFQVTNRFNYTFALFMCMHIHILEISSRRAGWIEVQQNKTPFCQHHSFIFSVYTVYSFFGNINWYYFDTAIRNSVSNSSYTSFTISLPITLHCLLIHIPLSFE